MQYQRISLLSGYSPSKPLNGRQIRTKLVAMVLSPAHVAQGIDDRGAIKSQQKEQKVVSRFPHQYKVGAPCYTLYHGPRRDKDPRWVPAIVTKVHGWRNVYARVCPRGPAWHRHIEQLSPRYGIEEDLDPGEEWMVSQEYLGSGKTPKQLGDSRVEEPVPRSDLEGGMHHPDTDGQGSRKPNSRLPTGSEYGPHNSKINPSVLKGHHLSIGNHLVKGLQGWWGVVMEYLVFQSSWAD